MTKCQNPANGYQKSLQLEIPGSPQTGVLMSCSHELPYSDVPPPGRGRIRNKFGRCPRITLNGCEVSQFFASLVNFCSFSLFW